MSLRRSGVLALALVLASGCRDVSKRAPAQTVYLAAMDPTSSILPTPNDLALYAAPGVTDAATRGLLFGLIGIGGWPVTQPIAVPLRTLSYDAASDAYLPAAPPPGIDDTTVNGQTVAFVRTSDSPPTVLDVVLYGYVADSNPALGDMVIVATTPLTAGTYTVAVRGGAKGVKTSDGLPLDQDLVPSLLAANKDLTNPENQPPGGIPTAEATQLEQIRQILDAGTFWGVPPGDDATRLATCVAAYHLPSAAYLPEGTCWLPLATSPAITDAYTAIDLVFPHQEAVSIQTFTAVVPPI